MCERCELPVQEPCCNLRSDQGWPIYGWRCVAISDGGRAIGRAKKEGRNSYGGVYYSFYGESPNPTGPRDCREVLQLHLSLDLLNIGPIRAGV